MLILILIDVQYSQKAVFSFKKGSNRQNHSSSSSLHPVKKFPLSKIPTQTPTGGIFPPTPYRCLENPEHRHMLFFSEYLIMKYFSVMLCQNIVSRNKMKQCAKVKNSMILYILYFPLVMALKSC